MSLHLIGAGQGSTSLSFGASSLSSVLGTPSLGVVNRTTVWLLDAATTEDVGGTVIIPTNWATAHVDLYWCNAGAGTGNVVFRFDYSAVTVGAATPDPASNTQLAAAAGANGIVVKTRAVTGMAVTAGFGAFEVVRIAADGSDTLANDAGLIGLTLTKAS